MSHLGYRFGIMSSMPVVSGDPYKAVVLADSPNLYVRLDNSSPFDESMTGATVTQEGTQTPTFATDATYGQVFNGGTAQWMTTATLSASAFTLEGVATYSTVSTYLALISSRSAGHGPMISSFPATGTVGYLNDSNAYSSTAVSTGTWYHFVFTWDGTTNRFYVNGVQKLTASNGGTTSGIGIEIGTYQSDFRKQWSGLIHSVSAYTTALSADRILAHAQAAGLA